MNIKGSYTYQYLSRTETFEKENGGLKLIFQNRRKVAILLFLAHNLQPPKQRFFYYPLLWWIELYQIELPVFIFGDDT